MGKPIVRLPLLVSAKAKASIVRGPCEYADEIGVCAHGLSEEEFLCNRQECPWPERREDAAWWAVNPGAITSE